jgi:hypothetical protein
MISMAKNRNNVTTRTSADDVHIQDYLDMISPSVIKFNTDHFICGNTYRCVWALREYPTVTDEQSYHVYQDRSGLKNKTKDIQQDAEATVLILKTPGIRSAEDKMKLIENYMSLALDCVKAHTFIDLEQQKQMLKGVAVNC